MGNFKRHAHAIGFLPFNPGSATGTLALSSAATFLAFSFICESEKVLSRLKAYCIAIAGTLANVKGTCTIYSDVSCLPGSAITNGVSTEIGAGSWPAANNWVEFSWAAGSRPTLSAGVRYWAVLKNSSPAPATDYPTIRYGAGLTTAPYFNCPNTQWGWAKVHTTTGDGGFGTGTAAVCGMRLEFTDGTFNGMPVSYITSPGTMPAYGSRETGVRFRTPQGSNLGVRGIVLYIRRAGSPTGDLTFRMYVGGAVYDAIAIPNANAVNSIWIMGYLPQPVLVPGGSLVTLTLKDGAADSLSNYFNSYEYTIENDANSKSLVPFGAARAYFDGSAWSYDDTLLIPFGLILDTDGEFDAVRSPRWRGR